MIIAPYNGKYLIPSRLKLLTKKDLENMSSTATDHNQVVACIKCPSKGYEYNCMLTVFLLTVPAPKWTVLQNKSPGSAVCLNKNCTRFLVEANYEVTISFISGLFKVYLPSKQDIFNKVPSSILQGLEKIKLILNVTSTNHLTLLFPLFVTVELLITNTMLVMTMLQGFYVVKKISPQQQI